MNNKLFSFFRSVAFKIYAAVLLCVLSLLLTNWLLNNFAFAGYYRHQKETALVEEFTVIHSLSHDQKQLMQYLNTRTADDALMVWTTYQLLHRDASLSLPEYSGGPFPLLTPLNMETGTYALTDRSPYSNIQTDTLALYGKASNGINVMLQTSLANIEESTVITNRFLLWSTLITLVISAVILWFLIRSFVRPIKRLSVMAGHMADLKFHDRLTVRGQDELAQLGNSLNTVSQAMENTLSELKTANARLRSDMERIERQNDARRSFISNVSHELKTPIALIQTYAEGLRENVAEDAEQRVFYCDVIGDEAERLSQMIARMTMLMQLESGKEELQIDRFDLHQLCSRLLERYAPLFREKQVSLPSLPSDPAFIWGDALLIENVMINYLTNALHHVEEQGIIRIDWTTVTDTTLRITVFNSGSHISETELPHIWESFYKVDKARTRSYGGTGIGLSVVAAIMRVHQMPYGVRNVENGVEFFIELPIK